MRDRDLPYRLRRLLVRHARSALYAVMPNWMVKESMMYASRYIKADEVVPEVEFMTVFGRVCGDK